MRFTAFFGVALFCGSLSNAAPTAYDSLVGGVRKPLVLSARAEAGYGPNARGEIHDPQVLNGRSEVGNPPVLNGRTELKDPPVLNGRAELKDPPVLNGRSKLEDPQVLN
jgi:hypothetical protein